MQKVWRQWRISIKQWDVEEPFVLPNCLRLRSCLFCEGRISVLKRWFKTPIQNALHGSTVHASLEKKTISWACTAHCSRLLFELKWTGKAFIWRHLNVVICDFAFMLPPESAFCSNHDRKRTFLGCVHAYFAKADPKRPSREYCSCFPREEDDFVSMHCALFEAIVRAQVNPCSYWTYSFDTRLFICSGRSTSLHIM